MTEEQGTRLSKVVAAQVPCSRRDAERYIAEGWVRVDGRVVLEPQVRVGSETVTVDTKAKLQPAVPATLLMHKPARMSDAQALASLSASSRWVGDTSGVRQVKSHAAGLASLLPLPDAASGLVVFSQDPRIIRKLREDAALVEQELVAEVQGTIAPDGLRRLSSGLVFRGRPLPPARVSWQSETRLRFALKGTDPAIVPWMCEQVGLRLAALRRIRIGRVPMAGLPAGQWRYLPPGERF